MIENFKPIAASSQVPCGKGKCQAFISIPDSLLLCNQYLYFSKERKHVVSLRQKLSIWGNWMYMSLFIGRKSNIQPYLNPVFDSLEAGWEQRQRGFLVSFLVMRVPSGFGLHGQKKVTEWDLGIYPSTLIPFLVFFNYNVQLIPIKSTPWCLSWRSYKMIYCLHNVPPPSTTIK
jgi:hypothetical protein